MRTQSGVPCVMESLQGGGIGRLRPRGDESKNVYCVWLFKRHDFLPLMAKEIAHERIEDKRFAELRVVTRFGDLFQTGTLQPSMQRVGVK